MRKEKPGPILLAVFDSEKRYLILDSHATF